ARRAGGTSQMKALTLELNGGKITCDVEPRETLADFLRDRCRLTAARWGCEHGACGACTVAVDGQATRSCLRLAIMCDGRSVQTLEGLDDDPTMEVLRRHFHQSHAVQCGFCTPGMLMMARDILLRMANPNAETVRDQLSGQICRCTGYSGIVRAIVAAGRELCEASRAWAWAGRGSNGNCHDCGPDRRLEAGRKLLGPFRTHACVQFFARARNRWERFLSIEWYARIDDDPRIALVVLRVVAHRIEGRTPAAV